MHVEYVTIERPVDYEWWQRNLATPLAGPFHDGDAHAGWFVAQKKRDYKWGAYRLPVVLYWSAPFAMEDRAEQVGDSELHAAVVGRLCDPELLWNSIAKTPITVEQYNELMELDYARYTDLIEGIVAACRNS